MESVPDLPLTGEDALHEPEPKAKSAKKRGSDDAKPRRPRSKTASASAEGDKPRRAARKSRSKTVSE
jgi:hypothetical protein